MGIAERRAREKETRRNEIMDAARKVFASQGFGGATMEEIAQEAELSPATIYLYFKNKYELYISLHVGFLRLMAETVEEIALRKDLNPLEQIREYIEALYGIYEFDPLTLTNLFRLQASRDLTELDSDTIEEMNTTVGRCVRTMSGIFEKGIREGYLKNYEKVVMADMFWSMFSGLILWEESKRLFNPKKQFLKPTLDKAIDVLLDGIKATNDS